MSIQRLLRVGKTCGSGSFEDARCYKASSKEDKLDIGSDVNDVELKCGAACFDHTIASCIALLAFLILAGKVTWITTCVLRLHACTYIIHNSYFFLINHYNIKTHRLPILFKGTCTFILLVIVFRLSNSR